MRVSQCLWLSNNMADQPRPHSVEEHMLAITVTTFRTREKLRAGLTAGFIMVLSLLLSGDAWLAILGRGRIFLQTGSLLGLSPQRACQELSLLDHPVVAQSQELALVEHCYSASRWRFLLDDGTIWAYRQPGSHQWITTHREAVRLALAECQPKDYDRQVTSMLELFCEGDVARAFIRAVLMVHPTTTACRLMMRGLGSIFVENMTCALMSGKTGHKSSCRVNSL